MIEKQDMPKAYEPQGVEDAIYAAWEKSGLFNPDRLPGDRPEAFSIVLPPPNVTGTLHMGHAVMLALEDIMTRFARMRGKKALWLPGTDHAAIATQTKVEKLLMEKGMKDPRTELGREAFLKEVDAFARQSHDTIVNQTKRMGASVDWSREAFTLDEARNLAVRTVFKMMYDDGLMYRGDRVVNWCPRCKSTLADDEVEYREEKTKFYYFKYGPVVIGTARPETKFLDKIIVVHPDDERYRDLVGKEFDVEWIDGQVKAMMVADPAADMAMGSGAMTITPAHSMVDFELAKKHGFQVVKIIDEDGKLTSAAGSFAGRNAHEAREEIVRILNDKGLVDHIDENYLHNLSVCYRCGTPIEPLPKLQWFINVNKPFRFRASKRAPLSGVKDGQKITLKQLMQHAVKNGDVAIIPDRFDKTYFHWIDNLRDWNVSRQIWYGHRVPVWYRGEETFVGIEAPKGEGWTQDPDTLDTWFSSGLWTFSTLGWPGETKDLETFHPTTVMETGYDILFFWVARMILMTTYALGEIPFRTVYLHGLVRDEAGRKMSKSLGNAMDPLDMIEKYGADATRLSLVIGTTPGNDTKLSEEKVAGYRNFTNKLWNIARFVLTSTEQIPPRPEGVPPPAGGGAGGGGRYVGVGAPVAKTLADRWILSRLSDVTARVTKHLDVYEFSAAGELLRDFTWSEFADWYLEIAKVQDDENTKSILRHVLAAVLKMWHPFMPFVTEEIWKQMRPGGELLMVAAWPSFAEASEGKPETMGEYDEEAEAQFSLIQRVVMAIRNLRAEYKVPPGQKINARFIVEDKQAKLSLESMLDWVKALARLDEVLIEQGNKEAITGVAFADCGPIGVYPVFIVDETKERNRLAKELDAAKRYVETLDKKLADKDFLSKAPEKVVATMKANRDEAAKKAVGLTAQLEQAK